MQEPRMMHREYSEYSRLGDLLENGHNTVNNVHVVDFLNNEKSLLNSFMTKFGLLLSHGKYNKAVKLYYSLSTNQMAGLTLLGPRGKRIIDVLKIIDPMPNQTGSSEPKPAKVIYYYQEIPVMKSASKKADYKVTAAIKVEDTKVFAGFALCTAKDFFTKERGRAIATGRLKKKPVLISTLSHATLNWPEGRLKNRAIINEVKRHITDVIQRKLMLPGKRRNSSIGVIVTGDTLYGVKGVSHPKGLGVRSLKRIAADATQSAIAVIADKTPTVASPQVPSVEIDSSIPLALPVQNTNADHIPA